MAVRLTVIGSSPAWPNPGGACSGYLVDDKLLLDCGPGVLAKLRQREPWPTVEAIAITHLHLDHWGDLVPWVWGSLFGPGEGSPRPRLWLPPGSRDELRPILARLGSEDMFERAFEVAEYESRTPFAAAAGLRVTAVPVEHYDMEAFGFRVEGDRILAYSGDSGPCPALGELAHDADLLLCEATLATGALDGPSRGHLAPDEVDAAAAGAHVKRILLTHRPDEREAPAGAELAYDGLELDF
jgi:ribonuclease BN (tRNA processing enzyme)